MKKIDLYTESGFSLLEVLLTVVVLAVGLLGVAGMQATSLKVSHESHLRSQASTLIHDMANRMRSNRIVARNNGYDGTHTGLTNQDPIDDCRQAGQANTGCTAQSVAAMEIRNWRLEIGRVFPGAQANITTSPQNTAGQFISTITLIWFDTESDTGIDDNDGNDDPENRTFRLTSVI